MIRPASMAEVMPLLNLAIGDDVQKIGLPGILNGCHFFILEKPENDFAYALCGRGTELWIQAAGGRGKDDLTALGFSDIEQRAMAGGFDTVGFQTRRPGLVRKSICHGYEIDGYILRKKIK